jgi:hypothetical protein
MGRNQAALPFSRSKEPLEGHASVARGAGNRRRIYRVWEHGGIRRRVPPRYCVRPRMGLRLRRNGGVGWSDAIDAGIMLVPEMNGGNIMNNDTLKDDAVAALRRAGCGKVADMIEGTGRGGGDKIEGRDLRETITRMREAGFARVAEVLEKASDDQRRR